MSPSNNFSTADMLQSLSLLLLLVVVAADRCPSQCVCRNGGTTVDCSRRKLTAVPIGLPNTTVTLNLAHNRILRLEDDAFSGLTKLNMLNVTANLISTVSDKVFRGCCSELQSLMLTSNRISSINTTVFDSLPSLRSLNLSENHFLEVPRLAKLGSVALVQLNLANNRLHSATFPKSYAASTRLKEIVLSGNMHLVQLGAGDFSSLKRIAVHRLHLSRCRIRSIEKGSLSVLTRLQFIDISHNPLQELGFRSLVSELSSARHLTLLDASDVNLNVSLTPDKLALLGGTSLRYLYLPQNRLMSIADHTFSNLTGLKHLDLTSTEVVSLGFLSFQGLDSLVELRLSENHITDLPALPQSLQKLDLSKNQLEDLAGHSFSGLKQLMWLNLRHNRLQTMKSDSFKDLCSLHWLDISHNILPYLSPGAFFSLTNMTFLNASNNRIKLQKSKKALFAGQEKLVMLDLSNNNMDAITQHVLSGLASVKYINLSRNLLGIGFMNFNSNEPLFVKASNVVELDLSSNSINVLPPLLFHNLTRLRTLRLSNNGFLSWDELHLFDGDVNLASLFLDGNQISVLNWTSIASLPGLRFLSLKDNPLACSCDMVWFRRWINETSVVLLDLSTYTCHSPPDATGKMFLQFNPDDLVCTETPILYITVALAGAFATTLITLAVIYRYRWRIRFRMHMACRRGAVNRYRATGYEPLAGRDLLYSAYISYCRSFTCKSEILDHLLPQIDGWVPVADANATAAGDKGGGGGLAVHIDEKFSPNRSVIESVVDAIDHSAIFIVFLCTHYLSHGLCELELDLAFTQNLCGRDGGCNVEVSHPMPCIVVTYGDLGPRCIPRQLVPTFEKGAHWKWADDDENSRRHVVDVLRDLLNDTGVYCKGVTLTDVAAAAATDSDNLASP